MHRINVLLPPPLGPTTATTSPSAKVAEIPCSTSTAPKAFVIWRISIMTQFLPVDCKPDRSSLASVQSASIESGFEMTK